MKTNASTFCCQRLRFPARVAIVLLSLTAVSSTVFFGVIACSPSRNRISFGDLAANPLSRTARGTDKHSSHSRVIGRTQPLPFRATQPTSVRIPDNKKSSSAGKNKVNDPPAQIQPPAKLQTLLLLVMESDARAIKVLQERSSLSKQQLTRAKAIARQFDAQFRQLLRRRNAILERERDDERVKQQLDELNKEIIKVRRAMKTKIVRSVSSGNTPSADSDSEGKIGIEIEFQNQIRPLLQKYCLDCHSGEASEGGIDLASLNAGPLGLSDQSDKWQSVYDAIADEFMPPSDAEQPTSEERTRIGDWIRRADSIERRSSQQKSQIRRLNRVEYENTLSELLRLDGDVFDNPAKIVKHTDYFQPATGSMPRHVLAISHHTYANRNWQEFPGSSSLPTDPPAEHGFTNDQSALSISPLLLEHYLDVANSIVQHENFPNVCRMWDALFAYESDQELGERERTAITRIRDANLHLQLDAPTCGHHCAALDAADRTRDAYEKTTAICQAERRLTVFLQRAFRRPPTSGDMSRYLRLFVEEFDRTESFTEAMKTTVSSILISPTFLYHDEFSAIELPANSCVEATADDYRMASRLSYFLWSSMPDDVLFQAAREGRLSDSGGLERQVERMMSDPRIKSLATDFGMQWLKVNKVLSAVPDREKFSQYYQKSLPPPAVSMMVEQLLLFETILVEDRSILEFVSTDFAYLNRILMDWYQLNAESLLGYRPQRQNFEDFFRVELPCKSRGGVLSSGAMLLSTSASDRSSPVYRGAWVLDVIFNQPPPPAPANVPALDDAAVADESLDNIRKRLEVHRENAACAACHDRIDPLGFALERYDAVGRFRKKYENGDPIDTSGEFNGMKFNSLPQLKQLLVRDKTMFVRAFVEHMMRYALGRKLEIADQPEVERITQAVIDQGCRFSAVVKEVVLSKPFRQMDYRVANSPERLCNSENAKLP